MAGEAVENPLVVGPDDSSGDVGTAEGASDVGETVEGLVVVGANDSGVDDAGTPVEAWVVLKTGASVKGLEVVGALDTVDGTIVLANGKAVIVATGEVEMVGSGDTVEGAIVVGTGDEVGSGLDCSGIFGIGDAVSPMLGPGDEGVVGGERVDVVGTAVLTTGTAGADVTGGAGDDGTLGAAMGHAMSRAP